jgi:hypothetical protein
MTFDLMQATAAGGAVWREHNAVIAEARTVAGRNANLMEQDVKAVNVDRKREQSVLAQSLAVVKRRKMASVMRIVQLQEKLGK